MADEKTGGGGGLAGYPSPSENHQQLIHRHAPSFIRHVLEAFTQRTLKATQAADQLGLSRSRLYTLSTAYLRARLKKRHGSGFLAPPAAITPLPGLSRSGPPEKAFEGFTALPVQLRRFRGTAPARLQTGPRPSPPLGFRPQPGSRSPAQTSPGSGAPLAAPPHRRTLAAGRLAPPLVSTLQNFLSHAQHAR